MCLSSVVVKYDAIKCKVSNIKKVVVRNFKGYYKRYQS